jgi:hypothetical protein
MKLITLNTFRSNRDEESNENSSTHQLADPETGTGDTLDNDVLTGYKPKSVRMVITSSDHGAHIDGDRDMTGIYVQSDMVVEVEERELSKTYQR